MRGAAFKHETASAVSCLKVARPARPVGAGWAGLAFAASPQKPAPHVIDIPRFASAVQIIYLNSLFTRTIRQIILTMLRLLRPLRRVARGRLPPIRSLRRLFSVPILWHSLGHLVLPAAYRRSSFRPSLPSPFLFARSPCSHPPPTRL